MSETILDRYNRSVEQYNLRKEEKRKASEAFSKNRISFNSDRVKVRLAMIFGWKFLNDLEYLGISIVAKEFLCKKKYEFKFKGNDGYIRNAVINFDKWRTYNTTSVSVGGDTYRSKEGESLLFYLINAFGIKRK